jgi:hypothetical protein
LERGFGTNYENREKKLEKTCNLSHVYRQGNTFSFINFTISGALLATNEKASLTEREE